MAFGFLPPQVDQLREHLGLYGSQIRALRRVAGEVVEFPRLGVEIVALVVFGYRLPPHTFAFGNQCPTAGVFKVLKLVC